VIVGLITMNVALVTLLTEFTVTVTGPGPEGAVVGTLATILCAAPTCDGRGLHSIEVDCASPLRGTEVRSRNGRYRPRWSQVWRNTRDKGEVPSATETLSNVAVSRTELDWLHTARPCTRSAPS